MARGTRTKTPCPRCGAEVGSAAHAGSRQCDVNAFVREQQRLGRVRCDAARKLSVDLGIPHAHGPSRVVKGAQGRRGKVAHGTWTPEWVAVAYEFFPEAYPRFGTVEARAVMLRALLQDPALADAFVTTFKLEDWVAVRRLLAARIPGLL